MNSHEMLAVQTTLYIFKLDGEASMKYFHCQGMLINLAIIVPLESSSGSSANAHGGLTFSLTPVAAYCICICSLVHLYSHSFVMSLPLFSQPIHRPFVLSSYEV